MKDIAIANVRNFALVGHTGSGKTTLVDALLHKMGVNSRMGSPDDGSSMADWTDEEKERKISIFAKPFDGNYKAKGGNTTRMVFIDTPGYADFFGQVVAGTSVADAALLLVDASSGIQVGTNRAWKRCEELGLARGIVITGLDKDNADYAGTLRSIQDVWGARCVPVVMATADGSGVVDVLAADDVPADLASEVETIKNSLVESAAETDDALIEKYLGGESLSADEIAAGLRGAVKSGGLVPVFAIAAKKDIGLDELMDGITRLFPTPEEVDKKDADDKEIDAKAGAPFAGFVWRSVTDPFVGQLTFLRVYGGTLKSEGEIQNATRDQKERIGGLYTVNGKKQDTVTEAHAGDIVAIAKLKHTSLGDTLCSGASRTMPELKFPRPVMSYSVMPKTQGDDDKLGSGLQRLADEDPTLTFERNTETHELILAGMGDVHLDVAVNRLKARSNVEVVLHTPKVPYKETVTTLGEGHYKHKKQSGGRGQYGEVYLRVERRDPGEEEWFINKIVGGAIPSGFIPAVQKGLVEGMSKGSIAGYPVTNVKVAIYDGSYHDVDSSEIAFKIAGARAFREGMSNAKPVLLEPIMKVKIMVPDQFMGDVTGDLNQKRGRILGMGNEDGMQVINAEVPQAEMFQYCSQLRSITGGRGTFDMVFDRYEVVPSNVTQKVVAEEQKGKEGE